MSSKAALSQLKAAIAALYETFDKYAGTGPVNGCACCTDPKDWQLLGGQTSQVPTAVLSRFAFSAMLTWGDLDDFKRFLPRLLELVALAPDSIMDIAQLIEKLEYGHWLDWPYNEQAAVEKYFKSLLFYAGTAGPDYVAFSEVVNGATTIGIDVTSALTTTVAMDGSLNSTLALCSLIENWASGFSSKERAKNKRYAPLLAWLLSSAVKEQIESAFYNNMENDEVAEKLSCAMAYLKTLS